MSEREPATCRKSPFSLPIGGICTRTTGAFV
jgi:hypothetical protein